MRVERFDASPKCDADETPEDAGRKFGKEAQFTCSGGRSEIGPAVPAADRYSNPIPATMATQAVSMSYSPSRFGDATRVNIVDALRGLWSVLLAWSLGRLARSPERRHSTRTLPFRLTEAVLLMIAVLAVMG